MGFFKIPNFDTLLNTIWVKQISRTGSILVVRAVHPIEAVGGGFRERDQHFDYGDEDLSKAAFESIIHEIGMRRRTARLPETGQSGSEAQTSVNME